MPAFLTSQRKVSTKKNRLRRGVPPKSPGAESFTSAKRSPVEWAYDPHAAPPLPTSSAGSTSAGARSPRPPKTPTTKGGFAYLAFPTSARGGPSSATGKGASSPWLNVPSPNRPSPPPRPLRPSMTRRKQNQLEAAELARSDTSGSASDARPASTLPTPFTSFPTPKLDAESASRASTASPLPVLEISDFGFDWGLDVYGSASGGDQPGDKSSDVKTSSSTPEAIALPTSHERLAHAPGLPPLPAGLSGKPQATDPVDRSRSTRRGAPAPIQIFTPLVRSPPRIDISSSASSPVKIAPASGGETSRPPSSMNLHPLDPDRQYALASASSSAASSSPSEGGASSAGLESEEAAGVVIGRGMLVSFQGSASTTFVQGRLSTVPPSVPSDSRASPSSQVGSNMRGSIYKNLPATPGTVYSPSSEYSRESSSSGHAHVGQSLIQLTVTQPSTPSASHQASDSSSSSHKHRPRLSQLIVPPPSTHLPPLARSPTSANTNLTSASPVGQHPGRPFTAALGASPAARTESPAQLLSTHSSNYTDRSTRSNPFQFSPARKSSQSLTPQSDPSLSTRSSPDADGRARPDKHPAPSPGLPQSYTPGSTHSFLPSPGVTVALDTPRTGTSSATSGKFSHPPRPSVTAYMAAGGPTRSRSESTPLVEASPRDASASFRPMTLSKSRWASDSDLRRVGSYITEEPNSDQPDDDGELAAPRMPAAYEQRGRTSPAPSGVSSFLSVQSLASSVLPAGPRPSPASSFRSTYAPGSESSASSASLPLETNRPAPPPLHHSHSTPMIQTINSIQVSQQGHAQLRRPSVDAPLPPSINLPLPDAPPLLFHPTPVAVQSISLADARTQFSTLDVQSIISLAIQSVAPAGSVRLLSAEAMSVLVPLEMRKLQARREALIAEFKGEAKRRKKVLKYLNEQRGGTSEGKAGRVAIVLTTHGNKGDAAAEELFTVCNQIEQLRSLLSDSNVGGLSLALGKLNASLIKVNERLQGERNEREKVESELAQLRAQLDGERTKTLEAEETKAALATELAAAQQALSEARLGRLAELPMVTVAGSSGPPSPVQVELGHAEEPAYESDRESEADESEYSHNSNRWSVSTIGGAAFFPFPPSTIPMAGLTAPTSSFPTSPSSFPVSPAPPSPTTPRLSPLNLAQQTSSPPPASETSYHHFPATPTLPGPLRPSMDEPAEDEGDIEVLVEQSTLTPETATSFATVRGPVPSSLGRSTSTNTKRSSSHGHHQGSSSISITIDSSNDLPSSTPTFALEASYPYPHASTYSATDDPTGPAHALRPKRSQRKRNGLHFRTNSEAGAADRFEASFDVSDVDEGEWVDIRPPRTSDTDSGQEACQQLRRHDSQLRGKSGELLGDLSLSFQRKKIGRTQSVKGLVSFFEKAENRKALEARKSAGETTESIMLALATASIWMASDPDERNASP